MNKEVMSSHERVLSALAHKTTDRVPISMICGLLNPPVEKKVNEYLLHHRGYGVEAYIDSFIDTAEVWIGGGLNIETDMWGVRRIEVTYGEGSYREIETYILKEVQTIEELKRHRWPAVKDVPIADIADQVKVLRKTTDKAVILANANLFETAWYMRGFEEAMLDMMIRPDMLHFIMEKVTSIYHEIFYEVLKRCRGQVDLVFTADDIGQQEGLLLPLEMWEEFIKPYHVRMNDMIHEFGAKVIYHTDGAVAEAVPGLMDMGIDVLQALQFSASGMDPQDLKTKYGDNLCFEGGMCVQHVLPSGTEEEVEAEAKRLIDILGRNGGYLCGPSHWVQAGTPPENVVRFFDVVQEYYPH